jgi:hypothetical protein
MKHVRISETSAKQTTSTRKSGFILEDPDSGNVQSVDSTTLLYTVNFT